MITLGLRHFKDDGTLMKQIQIYTNLHTGTFVAFLSQQSGIPILKIQQGTVKAGITRLQNKIQNHSIEKNTSTW